MDHEQEILDLKISLEETKFALVKLAVFLAEVASHSTPTFRQRLASNLQNLLGSVSNRQTEDARNIVLMFGRALVDPAFPLSSDPPDDLK
jgi:hypothetical protein